jgi:L-iditol 2-dehydrogenase
MSKGEVEMEKSNKIAMWYKPFDLRIEERPIEDPGPGEVQIEIKSALTCGTDVKTYKRGYPFRQPPYSLGHEFSGIVVAVGEGVDPELVGKRAVTSNGAGCQFCFYCKRDSDNLCENIESNFDEFVQMGGGFARYINVHAPIVKQNLMVFSESMSFEQAAMVEPVSVVLHGINKAEIEVGDTVAILGAGPIGLLMTQLAKLRGAFVMVVEKNEFRLNEAKKKGADILINPGETVDEVGFVKSKANGGRGPDRVIEAVGLPETWELAIKMARKGGIVVEFGGCPSDTKISVDTKRLHYDELTIKGSYSATAYETELAFSLLSRGIIQSEDYISGIYPLDKTKEALDAHLSGKGIKFEIKP